MVLPVVTLRFVLLSCYFSRKSALSCSTGGLPRQRRAGAGDLLRPAVSTGAVVSANLSTVGGLLIFALLVQPGATALQLTYNLKYFFLISAAAGILACVLGLVVSYVFDLPSGASVVLMATIIFAAAFVFSPKRRWHQG